MSPLCAFCVSALNGLTQAGLVRPLAVPCADYYPVPCADNTWLSWGRAAAVVAAAVAAAAVAAAAAAAAAVVAAAAAAATTHGRARPRSPSHPVVSARVTISCDRKHNRLQ